MLPNFKNLSPEDTALVESKLPEVALEIVRLIGIESALILFTQLGGQEWRFCKNERGTGSGSESFETVADAIGRKNAQCLGQNLAGEPVYIPRCMASINALRDQRIIRDFDELSKTLSSRRTIRELVSRYQLSHKKSLMKRTIQRHAQQCADSRRTMAVRCMSRRLFWLSAPVMRMPPASY